jgi:hypothetical protein
MTNNLFIYLFQKLPLPNFGQASHPLLNGLAAFQLSPGLYIATAPLSPAKMSEFTLLPGNVFLARGKQCACRRSAAGYPKSITVS